MRVQQESATIVPHGADTIRDLCDASRNNGRSSGLWLRLGSHIRREKMKQAIQRALALAAIFLIAGATSAIAAGPGGGTVSTEDYVNKATVGNLFEIRS